MPEWTDILFDEPFWPVVVMACFVALVLVALLGRKLLARVEQRILHEVVVELWTRPEVCRNCRYDLHGIRSDRCPECGVKIRAT